MTQTFWAITNTFQHLHEADNLLLSTYMSSLWNALELILQIQLWAKKDLAYNLEYWISRQHHSFKRSHVLPWSILELQEKMGDGMHMMSTMCIEGYELHLCLFCEFNFGQKKGLAYNIEYQISRQHHILKEVMHIMKHSWISRKAGWWYAHHKPNVYRKKRWVMACLSYLQCV